MSRSILAGAAVTRRTLVKTLGVAAAVAVLLPPRSRKRPSRRILTSKIPPL